MLKAPERPCRGCGANHPRSALWPGSPRQFCARQCRRDHYHRLERAEIERQRAEERERRLYEYCVQVWGKRKADQWRREKARSGTPA
jgi:hypothetical protein